MTSSFELSPTNLHFEANLGTARQMFAKMGAQISNPADPVNQTNRECLAIAAIFTEPTKFNVFFEATANPLRLALGLRKTALERQAVDLAALDNDGVRQTKIIPFIQTANEISAVLTQPNIEPGILENIPGPIYIDDPEFHEMKVPDEKIAFFSGQNTSLRRSLINEALLKIVRSSPPTAAPAAAG